MIIVCSYCEGAYHLSCIIQDPKWQIQSLFGHQIMAEDSQRLQSEDKSYFNASSENQNLNQQSYEIEQSSKVSE